MRLNDTDTEAHDCPWLDPAKRLEEKILDELIKGRDLVTELRLLLPNTDASQMARLAVLAGEVEASFSNCLSMLIGLSTTDAGTASSVHGIYHKRNFEESSRVVAGEAGPKGHKRRKTCESWSKDTPTKVDDGHAWRKYGQKAILNAKHPRNYYRCTHKDRGCQAKKHVQQISDNPPIFRTTYTVHHTCRSSSNPHHDSTLLDSHQERPNSSSVLLNFESFTTSSNQVGLNGGVLPSTTMELHDKQGTPPESLLVMTHVDHSPCPPSPSLSPECAFTPSGGTRMLEGLSSTDAGSHYARVFSSTASPQIFDNFSMNIGSAVADFHAIDELEMDFNCLSN